jgi:hypothetical protein
MRSVKPRVFLLVVAAAGFIASAALAAGLRSESSAAGRAALNIPSTVPLVVVGKRFEAGERVSITANIGTAQARKTVTADGSGRFTTRFRTATPCSPIYVAAKGARGSRAGARRHVIPGACGIDPALDR